MSEPVENVGTEVHTRLMARIGLRVGPAYVSGSTKGSGTGWGFVLAAMFVALPLLLVWAALDGAVAAAAILGIMTASLGISVLVEKKRTGRWF